MLKWTNETTSTVWKKKQNKLQIVETSIGKYSKSERAVKDKQERNITGTEQQLNRWAEHFEDLLNTPATLDPQTYHQQ